MKKFLVFLLTLAMLLGSTSLFVAAEQPIMGSIHEYAVPHAAMMTRWAGPGAGPDGSNLQYSIKEMDYVEFEVYFSHPALLKNIPFCFELTSSGTCDVEEDSILVTWSELAELKEGWNTVRIPLSAFPERGCDRTRFNFLRIFSNEAFSLPEGVKLEYYYRKVAFGTEAGGDQLVLPIGEGDAFNMDLIIPPSTNDVAADEHTLPIFDCSIPMGAFTVDTADSKAGGSSLSYTLGNYTDAAGNPISANGQVTSFTFDQVTGSSTVDATKMDTLEFWFYVSDVKALEGISFVDTGLELTSSGRCDAEEINWRLPDILAQCKNGWNEIRLPFSTAGKNGTTDFTRLNFMRFFFVNAANLPEKPIIIKIDNIRLTDYEATAAEEFRPMVEAFYNKVIKTIEAIPAWDEDDAEIVAQYKSNGEKWRETYDSMVAELEEMPLLAQSLAADMAIKKDMNNLKRWVERYEKYALSSTGEPTPDPDPDPTPDPDPDKQEGEEEQPPAYNKTMIIIIAAAAVLCMLADVLVYGLLRKKDKKKAE